MLNSHGAIKLALDKSWQVQVTVRPASARDHSGSRNLPSWQRGMQDGDAEHQQFHPWAKKRHARLIGVTVFLRLVEYLSIMVWAVCDNQIRSTPWIIWVLHSYTVHMPRHSKLDLSSVLIFHFPWSCLSFLIFFCSCQVLALSTNRLMEHQASVEMSLRSCFPKCLSELNRLNIPDIPNIPVLPAVQLHLRTAPIRHRKTQGKRKSNYTRLSVLRVVDAVPGTLLYDAIWFLSTKFYKLTDVHRKLLQRIGNSTVGLTTSSPVARIAAKCQVAVVPQISSRSRGALACCPSSRMHNDHWANTRRSPLAAGTRSSGWCWCPSKRGSYASMHQDPTQAPGRKFRFWRKKRDKGRSFLKVLGSKWNTWNLLAVLFLISSCPSYDFGFWFHGLHDFDLGKRFSYQGRSVEGIRGFPWNIP